MIITINKLLDLGLLEKWHANESGWTEYRVASGHMLASRAQPYAVDIVDCIDIDHAKQRARIITSADTALSLVTETTGVADKRFSIKLDDTISLYIFRMVVDPL